jgi:hypothetical protein
MEVNEVNVVVEYQHGWVDYRVIDSGQIQQLTSEPNVGRVWFNVDDKRFDRFEFIPAKIPPQAGESIQAARSRRGLPPLPTEEEFNANILHKHTYHDGCFQWRLMNDGLWYKKDLKSSDPPTLVDFSNWDRYTSLCGINKRNNWIEEMIPAINADRARREVTTPMHTEAESAIIQEQIRLEGQARRDRERAEAAEKAWKETGIARALGFDRFRERERALKEFIIQTVNEMTRIET